MKFGQIIIPRNTRNIFFEKTENVVEKLSPYPFLKNQIDHISSSIVLTFMQFVFVAWQVEGYRNMLKTKLQTTCFYLI